MKVMRSEICSTSCVLCEEKRMLRPSSFMTAVSSRRISWRATGSRPVVGSSRTSKRGQRASTNSSVALTRWPCERPLIFCCAFKPNVLRSETDIPLCLDLFGGHRMPEHTHVAAILMNQAQKNAYGRGFPGAVGPDQSHDLACGNLQIDVVEREVAVTLGHAFKFDDKVRHDFSFSA